MKTLPAILLAAWCCAAHAAEVIPPVPAQWFNDYAGVVSPATAARLNQTLQDFERESSSQILVAVFQHMESASSIEDYTVRVAQAWKVGQKGRNNGAVLFVFVQDRKMFIQVGYGLEGALPDATCKRIIEDEIKPHFRNNDFDGGLSAGVAAILKAAKGEYKAAGHSPAPLRGNGVVFLIFGLFLFALLFVILKALRGGGRWHGVTLGSSGWSSGWGSRRAAVRRGAAEAVGAAVVIVVGSPVAAAVSAAAAREEAGEPAMKPKDFISQLDEAILVAAIAEAERQTSGEIRVFLSHRKPDDAVAAAQHAFDRLGMARTRRATPSSSSSPPKRGSSPSSATPACISAAAPNSGPPWPRRCPATSAKRSSPPASFTPSARPANSSPAISPASPATSTNCPTTSPTIDKGRFF